MAELDVGIEARPVHKRSVPWLVIATIPLPVVLLAGRTEKLTEEVRTVGLGNCALDYHASDTALALACPGVDYIRLWPLPVVQPWEELETPRPQRGQIASMRTWSQIGS